MESEESREDQVFLGHREKEVVVMADMRLERRAGAELGS